MGAGAGFSIVNMRHNTLGSPLHHVWKNSPQHRFLPQSSRGEVAWHAVLVLNQREFHKDVEIFTGREVAALTKEK